MSRSSKPRSGRPPRRDKGASPGASLYLLVAFAVLADGGGPQPLLVFVQGADARGALPLAIEELTARGWRDIEVQSVRRLLDDPADEPDEFARDAMIRARTTGFDMIRYGI